METEKFNKRAFVSAAMFVSGFVLPLSGYMNHVQPLDAFTTAKHFWMSVHNASAVLFTIFAIMHVKYNWLTMLHHVKRIKSISIKKEAVLAFIIVVFIVGVITMHALRVHYDMHPPTCEDYGTIFMADNMRMTPIVTAISESGLPETFALKQNYSNPFNPGTKIIYQLKTKSNVTLKVFDVLGREVASLVNEKQSAGKYEVQFNGNNLPSGIYFYKLVTDGFTDIKKMILIK